MENNNKRKALGRGLEQLFSNERIDFDNFEQNLINNTKKNEIMEINVNEIRSNPYQPREVFDENALNELAQSIKEHGIVQPIIVKKSIKGYDLIAGERRTKAARIAGLTTIPAIIKDFTDQEMMEIALIENIQRENLNSLEEAKAFQKIIKQTNMTQEEVAAKFGKSRSYITNLLGLLSLPTEVQKLVEQKKLTMSHARALSKITDSNKVVELANRVVKENLNVRDIEKITSGTELPKRVKINRQSNNIKYSIYENVLREKVGTKVKINNRKIEIPFDSDKDLERILEILHVEIEGD